MSNTLHFTGRLAKAPALTRPGTSIVCKFVLIRNEYAGQERDERKVAIPFVAFGGQAESIAAHCMEGDQLVIEARIENNNYKDKDGEDKYEYNFVVSNFEFGAPGKLKREHLTRQGQG